LRAVLSSQNSFVRYVAVNNILQPHFTVVFLPLGSF